MQFTRPACFSQEGAFFRVMSQMATGEMPVCLAG